MAKTLERPPLPGTKLMYDGQIQIAEYGDSMVTIRLLYPPIKEHYGVLYPTIMVKREEFDKGPLKLLLDKLAEVTKYQQEGTW